MNAIRVIASGTFGNAVRRKILLVFLGVGLVLIVAGFASVPFEPGRDLTVIKSIGLGVIGLAGVFTSVILSINLVPEEIERRTIYTILSKPVDRYQFLCGKFLGGLMTVLFNVGVMGIAFIALMTAKEHHFNIDVFRGVVLLLFQMLLVGAIGLFFSVFMTPFVNFFMTFAVYLLGSMSSVTGALASNPDGKKSPLVTGFFSALNTIVPNFENYNVQNPLLHANIKIVNMNAFMTQCILYAIVYTAILMTFAVLIFERKEV